MYDGEVFRKAHVDPSTSNVRNSRARPNRKLETYIETCQVDAGPFCTKTKDLFTSLGVDASVVELDTRDDGARKTRVSSLSLARFSLSLSLSFKGTTWRFLARVKDAILSPCRPTSRRRSRS